MATPNALLATHDKIVPRIMQWCASDMVDLALYQAVASVCKQWRVSLLQALERHWGLRRQELCARREVLASARSQLGPEDKRDLDRQLRHEVETLIDRFNQALCRPYDIRQVVRSFDGLDVLIALLASGASPCTLRSHVLYPCNSYMFDMSAPALNAACLFVFLAFAIETLSDYPPHVVGGATLAWTVTRSIEVYLSLSVAPDGDGISQYEEALNDGGQGSLASRACVPLTGQRTAALCDNTFSLAVPYYHEYEINFGSVTQMCRSLFRSGRLYDTRQNRLHLYAGVTGRYNPVPGNQPLLQLKTLPALQYVWAVFEAQSLMEAQNPQRPDPRVRLDGGAAYPGPVHALRSLDLLCPLRCLPIVTAPVQGDDPEAVTHTAHLPLGRRMLPGAIWLLKYCGTISLELLRADACQLCKNLQCGDRGRSRKAVGIRLAKCMPDLDLVTSVLSRTLALSPEEVAASYLPCFEQRQMVALFLDGFSQNPPDRALFRWLLKCRPALRKIVLDSVPSLVFELARGHRSRALQTLLKIEPQLVASYRMLPCGRVVKDKFGLEGAMDLLTFTCSLRGLVFRMVEAILATGCFAACEASDMTVGAACTTSHGDETAHAVAKLWGIAMAAKIRNRHTLDVLLSRPAFRDAWRNRLSTRLAEKGGPRVHELPAKCSELVERIMIAADARTFGPWCGE